MRARQPTSVNLMPYRPLEVNWHLRLHNPRLNRLSLLLPHQLLLLLLPHQLLLQYRPLHQPLPEEKKIGNLS